MARRSKLVLALLAASFAAAGHAGDGPTVEQSVTAGEALWSPALDTNTGEAAIYAPMDVGLPADGVLAQTRGGQRWAFADLDFAALEASRARAQVANDRDWMGQLRPGMLRARVEGFEG